MESLRVTRDDILARDRPGCGQGFTATAPYTFVKDSRGKAIKVAPLDIIVRIRGETLPPLPVPLYPTFPGPESRAPAGLPSCSIAGTHRSAAGKQ
jgi:hypothetical protein